MTAARVQAKLERVRTSSWNFGFPRIRSCSDIATTSPPWRQALGALQHTAIPGKAVLIQRKALPARLAYAAGARRASPPIHPRARPSRPCSGFPPDLGLANLQEEIREAQMRTNSGTSHYAEAYAD